MSEQLEQTARAESRGLLNYVSENRAQIGGAAALSGIAVAATAAEYTGLGAYLPEADRAEMLVTSGRHPVVGYLGAWAASSFLGNRVMAVKATAAGVGATMTNFLAEGVQRLSPFIRPEYVAFWSESNLQETGKDYILALGGFGLFLYLQSRDK
ncbi:MAG TPA: hypothetical protein VFX86_02960 [Candidatus Saccharimonadales bacterium]|nr:hypothetical protein [Candidatus Saccharimonadales bacterium]